MNRFGYIINSNGDLVEKFRLGKSRATELETIVGLDFSNCQAKKLYQIIDLAEFVLKLKKRIKYYLSIRNNENPDYGIDWKNRFEESEMFNSVNVLGKEMKLFCGNEDNIISFLANIYNQINISNNGISWLLVKNDFEFREFVKVVNKS